MDNAEEYKQQSAEEIRLALYDNPQHNLHVRFREALKEIKDGKDKENPLQPHKKLSKHRKLRKRIISLWDSFATKFLCKKPLQDYIAEIRRERAAANNL